MGRKTKKLSVEFVERGDLKPGLYGDGGGLYLQVSSRRTKSWVYRFMIDGRARKMGLGEIGLISLAKARVKAAAAHSLVVDGIDPIEDRKARRAGKIKARSAYYLQNRKRIIERATTLRARQRAALAALTELGIQI